MKFWYHMRITYVIIFSVGIISSIIAGVLDMLNVIIIPDGTKEHAIKYFYTFLVLGMALLFQYILTIKADKKS